MSRTPTPEPTIYLYIREGWYCADFRKATNAAELCESFRTTIVPLPYAPPYPSAKIVAALQASNPGHRIVLSAFTPVLAELISARKANAPVAYSRRHLDQTGAVRLMLLPFAAAAGLALSFLAVL